MKRLLAIVVTVAALTISSQSLEAQDYNFGYQFGAGIEGARRPIGRPFLYGGGFRPTPRIEQPPYFSLYPPVYYSQAVKRPYGISPFAAPAGIAPVELAIPVADPITKMNPYFEPEVQPVPEETLEAAKPASQDKVTQWQLNPYQIEGIVRR